MNATSTPTNVAGCQIVNVTHKTVGHHKVSYVKVIWKGQKYYCPVIDNTPLFELGFSTATAAMNKCTELQEEAKQKVLAAAGLG